MKFSFVLLLVIVPTNTEDTDPCSICTCTENAQILTIDCTYRRIEHTLQSWPSNNATAIKASFTGNTIRTLDALPATTAQLEIVLSKCNITYLSSKGLFVKSKNVKYVDLSHNLLTLDEMSADKFKGPFNESFYEPLAIEDLNLAYNQIHSLNKNIFEHMPNLQRLNLEGNDFYVLDIQTQLAITSVKGLKVLNLANNELTELVDNTIKGLHLIKIDLSNNSLEFVPTSLGEVGQSLEVLILDGNPIMELVADSFMGLENVQELYVNNLTQLKYVNANTFVPMKKLRKLQLRHNFLLIDIAREAFGVNQTLEELYLDNNVLYRLDHKLLPWSKLRVFEFKENPFDCSCDLYNITRDLSRDITRNEDGPYCRDPRNDRFTQVFSLKSDICLYKSTYEQHREIIKYHFSIMRAALVVLSVILMVVALLAVVLGYFKYKKYKRNFSYPYASQVLYNPLSTNRF